MRKGKSIQEIRRSYRQRQRMAPFIVGALAVLMLVIGGLCFALYFLTPSTSEGISLPAIPFLSSATPSPTQTSTPTVTPTITPTPTITFTPTIAQTPTPAPTETKSGPFTYIVQEGDTIFGLANQFALDPNYLIEYNKLSVVGIYVGQELIIPLGIEPPTVTALPTYLPKGREIVIVVKANDSLQGLASTYNSTMEDIILKNEDVFGKWDKEKDKPPALQIGMRIKVPVNLVTHTPTVTPPLSLRQTQTQESIATAMAIPTK